VTLVSALSLFLHHLDPVRACYVQLSEKRFHLKTWITSSPSSSPFSCFDSPPVLQLEMPVSLTSDVVQVCNSLPLTSVKVLRAGLPDFYMVDWKECFAQMRKVSSLEVWGAANSSPSRLFEALEDCRQMPASETTGTDGLFLPKLRTLRFSDVVFFKFHDGYSSYYDGTPLDDICRSLKSRAECHAGIKWLILRGGRLRTWRNLKRLEDIVPRVDTEGDLLFQDDEDGTLDEAIYDLQSDHKRYTYALS